MNPNNGRDLLFITFNAKTTKLKILNSKTSSRTKILLPNNFNLKVHTS